MSSNARHQLERWLQTIDVKGTVLDVGGVSRPVKGRTKSWQVDDYKILDKGERKPEATAYYVVDINYPINYIPQFDIVFCLEVMEYIFNPVQALRNINDFLKPNGVLYISFHFLFPHHSPPQQDYLRYTKRGVIKLLEETGFEIEKMIPKTTIVPDILKEFCKAESKVYKSQGEIGYLIKGRKNINPNPR